MQQIPKKTYYILSKDLREIFDLLKNPQGVENI